MRLLYTITAYPPSVGGAQSYFHELAHRLNLLHDVTVATHWDQTRTDWLLGTTLRAPQRSATYTLDGVPVHRINLTGAERLRVAPWVLGYYPIKGKAIAGISDRVLRHLEPLAHGVDLVHNGRVGREPLSFASLQLARQLDVPFVLTPFHHPRWVGWNYRAYLELYRQADAVIALTETERETLIDVGVRPERIFVTGMGPVLTPSWDANSFRSQFGIDGPMVLFVGQKYRYKGCKALLHAAPRVWARFPETRFAFIGPRTRHSRALFRQVRDPRILEIGVVDRTIKTNALAACDMLCVPSLQESFGAVFVEAWMMGKPVIGGEAPALGDVICEGVDGFRVAQNPALLAERIVTLLDRPQMGQQMGQRGREKALSHYTWEILTAKTESIYEEILRGSVE